MPAKNKTKHPAGSFYMDTKRFTEGLAAASAQDMDWSDFLLFTFANFKDDETNSTAKLFFSKKSQTNKDIQDFMSPKAYNKMMGIFHKITNAAEDSNNEAKKDAARNVRSKYKPVGATSEFSKTAKPRFEVDDMLGVLQL